MDPLIPFTISRADPQDAAVARLIRIHLENSDDIGDDTSNHTMGVAALCADDIAFWTISDRVDLLGCGALKTLGNHMVEVKSVHVLSHARGRGVANALMEFLIAEARRDGCTEMVLETGTMEAYAAARALYKSLGFSQCGPIPGYCEDPNSLYMRLAW